MSGSSKTHDTLFHLFMVCKLENGKEIRFEKNFRLNVAEYNPKPNTDRSPIGGIAGKTLNELFEVTKKAMGKDRFFRYDAINENCQDFMLAVVKANGLQADKSFIKQDIKDLVPGWVERLGMVATQFKNRLNLVTEGEGIFHPKMLKKDLRCACDKEVKGSGLFLHGERRGGSLQDELSKRLTNALWKQRVMLIPQRTSIAAVTKPILQRAVGRKLVPTVKTLSSWIQPPVMGSGMILE